MTDLQKFIELYKSIGIDLKPHKCHTNICIRMVAYDDYYEDRDTRSELFEGYCGFYKKLIFDQNGKFIKQEFLE